MDMPSDTTPYQVLPALTREERAALQDSIAAVGVLQPVVVDEHGVIIDGHHRSSICHELGIEVPTVVLDGLTEEQKVEQALVLNLGRRNLSIEQKRTLVRDLRERGHSVRWVSESTGIPKSTVYRLSHVGPAKPTVPAETPWEVWWADFSAHIDNTQAASGVTESADGGDMVYIPDTIEEVVGKFERWAVLDHERDILYARADLLILQGEVPDAIAPELRQRSQEWKAHRAHDGYDHRGQEHHPS